MAKRKASGGRISGGTAQLQIEAATPAAAPAAAPRRPRRAYEGAIVNRLTHGWVTSATSADAEIDGSLVKLRDRSRQLRRDSPYVRQAIRAIGANVIGRGIRILIKPKQPSIIAEFG
jgi:capsid protein